MAVSTDYTETPWSTYELAALLGLNSIGRARQHLNAIDRLIFEGLAPDYIARGVRADQAANSIRHLVARLYRMFESGDGRVAQHVTQIIKLAHDRQVGQKFETAAWRMRDGRSGKKAPKAAGRKEGVA